MSAFEPEFWHHDKRLSEWDAAEDQRDQDERDEKERYYGRLALTCLILAVAALTRSPEVVAWVLTVVCAVWLGGYYLTLGYRAAGERIDRDVARALSDVEDPTALARAVGYHCLPLLTEDRVREESADLVIGQQPHAPEGADS